MGTYAYDIPNGREFADLMCSMDLEPLELVPSPPRTYPTNYFDNRLGMPPRERHTHYWDGSPVKYE